MPSHLVSAETGFPQGVASNGPPSVVSGSEAANSISGTEEIQAPIEGMTREEGDGEGEKESSSENNWFNPDVLET